MTRVIQPRLLSWSVALSVAFTISAADMLIIAPEEMAVEAESLADLHRKAQGMEVKVTVDTEIAAVPAADAVKDYVRQYYEEGLKYLLLIGEGYGDEHSDAWYGMLSASSGSLPEYFTAPDIAVGRIPAVSVTNLADYVEKARCHLSTGTSRYSHDVIIACDNGDSHEHLDRAERLAREFDKSVVHKAYIDLDRLNHGVAVITRSRIIDALRDGTGLMMYVGHGSPTAVTGEGLWDSTTALSVTNSHAPWAFFSSCAINAFRNFETTLAEAMLYNRSGGAIGVIAATETVYSSYNQEIALSFIDKCNSAPSTVPAGDLWLAAQQECIAAARRTLNGSYGRNVIAYTFAGDPALPYYVPELEVRLDVPSRVMPRERFSLAAEVISAGREHYDGVAEVTVYAPARDRVTLGQAGDAAGRRVTCRDIPLWRGSVMVKDSRFVKEIILPEADAGEICVTVHFRSDEGKEGYGITSDMILTATEGSYADCIAPTVGLRYDGGSLVAEVTDDDSGVNSSSLTLGASPVMTVDGCLRMPLTVDCSTDGVMRFTASVSQLSTGKHEACFSVSDNAGNRAESRISFEIPGGEPVLTLGFPDSPARGSVEFSWDHNLSGDVALTLIVTDITGETVLNKAFWGCDSYEWDLSGIESGIYFVRLLATDGRHHIAADPRRLTVINGK